MLQAVIGVNRTRTVWTQPRIFCDWWRTNRVWRSCGSPLWSIVWTGLKVWAPPRTSHIRTSHWDIRLGPLWTLSSGSGIGVPYATTLPNTTTTQGHAQHHYTGGPLATLAGLGPLPACSQRSLGVPPRLLAGWSGCLPGAPPTHPSSSEGQWRLSNNNNLGRMEMVIVSGRPRFGNEEITSTYRVTANDLVNFCVQFGVLNSFHSRIFRIINCDL